MSAANTPSATAPIPDVYRDVLATLFADPVNRHLLIHHPDRDSISRHTPSRSALTDLMWMELALAEAELPRGPLRGFVAHFEGVPAAYFLRRREVERLRTWSDGVRELGPFWARIVIADADETDRFLVALGERLVAISLLRAPTHDGSSALFHRLKPFGAVVSRRIVDTLSRLHDEAVGSEYAAVSGQLAAALDPLLAAPPPGRLTKRFGLLALATLLDQLDEERVGLASELARSRIVDLLMRTTPIKDPSPALGRALVRAVEDVLAPASAGSES